MVTLTKSSITEWLDNSQADLEQLAQWLTGRDMMAGPNDQSEPYSSIIEYIGEDNAYKEKLVGRVAEYLATQPDMHRHKRLGDRLLYNLYVVCAWLKKPEILGEQLEAMKDRNHYSGEWRGVSVENAFENAYRENT